MATRQPGSLLSTRWPELEIDFALKLQSFVRIQPSTTKAASLPFGDD